MFKISKSSKTSSKKIRINTAGNCRRDVVSRKRGDASRIDDQKNSFEYYIILIIPQQMHTLSILDWEELRGIVEGDRQSCGDIFCTVFYDQVSMELPAGPFVS